MQDCLFCRIAAGGIPSEKLYEDDLVFVFRDIHPQAPVHALIVPKTHVSGLDGLESLPDATLAACLRAAARIAEAEGVAQSGWRLVSNCGTHGCQSVRHLHFHLLGGRQLKETMG